MSERDSKLYWQSLSEMTPAEVDRLAAADAETPLMARRTFSFIETARFLGLHSRTLYQYQQRGTLPPPDLVDADGQPFYFLSTLLAWNKTRRKHRYPRKQSEVDNG